MRRPNCTTDNELGGPSKSPKLLLLEQESPAVDDKPARRESIRYGTIRYDTKGESKVDSKAEY